jgi:hypothetical protein
MSYLPTSTIVKSDFPFSITKLISVHNELTKLFVFSPRVVLEGGFVHVVHVLTVKKNDDILFLIKN